MTLERFAWRGATITVLASAARTTSDSSLSLDRYGPATSLRVQLECIAASGTTPTLDVTLEDTVDGVNWNPIATFTRLTGTGREVLNVTEPFGDRLRVSWVIGGTTPSFTFGVVALAQ